MKNQTKYLFLYLSLTAFLGNAQTQLLKDFQTPPNAAKPRVWWHWMNGNITKDGIQKDLDWMERIGIGGFHNFDANLFTPVVVPKKLVFMTPEWKDAFKFTIELADKKGFEMTIAGSPGWSVTGGPWVEPKDGMKKYVWTETRVMGGKAFEGKLPMPSDVVGKFQNVLISNSGINGEYVGKKPNFYQDAAIIAYRLPQNEVVFTDFKPKVMSSGGSFSLQNLTDGDLNTTTPLPPKAIGEDMWIQYAFDAPQTFKAFSIVGASQTPLGEFEGNPENRTLKVSDDGVSFKDVAKVSGSTVPQNTVGFAPTTAKFWRIAFKTLPPPFNPFTAMLGMPPATKPDGVNVAEFVLYTTDRIDQFEDKAGFTPWKEDSKSFLAQNADASTGGIIDLTAQMKPDGSLDWTPKEGEWLVLRFGYALTGRQNHPASPEATGLEVDKLDKEAVRKYINSYLDMYKDATGGLMGAKGLQSMILDSYEAGHMTWTKGFPEEFKKRRGYDILKYLPVLTGRIVKNTETSEQFLWDFRKTIGELIVENHYDVIGEELHKRGMKRYTESHENKRIYLADGMDVKRNAEIPMAAMWTPGSLGGGATEEVRSEGDIRESASVANIYGQNIVAAESMTSVGRPFQEYPERLKRTADLEMASGLNRFIIHTSVHQPLDDKQPGFSLGPFGQYFTRHETWAEQGGKAWMAYLGRSCHLLQQGKNVADVLYYYGENTNITWLTRTKLPPIPSGYEFDFVNSTALMSAIDVKNGKLVAKSGNTYRLLVLDETAKNMTLPVLKRMAELVKLGAKVMGTKPEQSPSLGDNPAEFKALVNDIWNNPNVLKGSITTALNALNVAEDVVMTNMASPLLYRHRQTANEDIYWLDNRSDEENRAEISFNVSGKKPELWHPQTGKVENVSFQIKGGRTIIPLHFDSWEAYFIVFKENTTVLAYSKSVATPQTVATISGTWTIDFPKIGAIKTDKLNSWTTFAEIQNPKSNSANTEGAFKYFSGTASYQNTFKINQLDKKANYNIDLGDVKNVAEVILNGKNMGIAWKKPFKLDITEAIKKGDNTIEIKVTNLWVNRLIGDAQPDAKKKATFTTMPFYQADAPLLPSGLMGPVMIFKK